MKYKLYQVYTKMLSPFYTPIAAFQHVEDANKMLKLLREEYTGLTFFYVRDGK